MAEQEVVGSSDIVMAFATLQAAREEHPIDRTALIQRALAIPSKPCFTRTQVHFLTRPEVKAPRPINAPGSAGAITPSC
jgi:hypothetical protein